MKLNVINLKDKERDINLESLEVNEITSIIYGDNNKGLPDNQNDDDLLKNIENIDKNDDHNKNQSEVKEITNFKILSVRDYFAASHRDVSDWDNRTFLEYFWDVLEYQNMLFYSFFRRSLLTPYYIRITLFFIQMILIFLLNCMMYTDYYIDKRINHLSMVKFL